MHHPVPLLLSVKIPKAYSAAEGVSFFFFGFLESSMGKLQVLPNSKSLDVCGVSFSQSSGEKDA